MKELSYKIEDFTFNETKKAINTSKLHVFYGELEAIKDVSITILENTITAFIGPSGCGKSTLLKTFNRMNDLVECCKITGVVEVGGVNIYKNIDVSTLRKNVGMVFQKPNPFQMSIYDNVAYGPRTHGIKKKSVLDSIVFDALNRAAMWNEVKDRLTKSAMSLSGGQQQRLCIARALAVKPKILLMDEPTSALDPISTGHIEDLCKELRKQFTIVIVTHNMQQAARISDKTAFFLLGDMLEYGNTKDIFSSPKNEKCERYITGKFG
ncbi:MAG: phosphate ABC transporter ATP-binding protein PstB [Christensenellaceae bacterium]|jgi:phosphate transport system ATP-binding protein|nr:phosphate ABC transporter ATP-binding protein PstB [Christensenellaceae bacterium]